MNSRGLVCLTTNVVIFLELKYNTMLNKLNWRSNMSSSWFIGLTSRTSGRPNNFIITSQKV